MVVPISVYYGGSFCCDIPHLQVSLEGQISRQSVKQSLSNGHIPSGDQIPWKFCEQYQDTVFPSLSGARIVRIATHPDDMKVTSIFWLMVLVYHILQKFQHLFSFLNLSLISAWIWFASSWAFNTVSGWPSSYFDWSGVHFNFRLNLILLWFGVLGSRCGRKYLWHLCVAN